MPVGQTALEIAGDAATGMKAIVADISPSNAKGQEVLTNFKERYEYMTLAWYLGSAYDDVYIAAECLKNTGDDQDADGFRDCLYEITWSGAIGENYTFDEKGEVGRSDQRGRAGLADGGEDRRQPGIQGPGLRSRGIDTTVRPWGRGLAPR